MLTQPLPNNKVVEDAVLAGFIIEDEVKDKIHEITDEHFYDVTNKLIYNAITELIAKEKTVDLITVSDLLKNINNSIEIISQMTDFYHTGKFETYLDKLKEYGDRRKNIKSAMKLIENMHDEHYESRLEMKNETQAMFDIDVTLKNKENYDSQTIGLNIMQKFEDDLNNEDTQNKLTYGLKELDVITAGLHNGEMTVLAAGTGQGKTSFALQAVLRLAIKGNHCVLFSQEMTKESIGNRMISNMSCIDGNKIRQPKYMNEADKEKYIRQNRLFSTLPIHIHDKCSNIEEMTEYCRKLKNEGKLDVIFVDYLGLCKSLKGKSNNREREVAELSWGFKKMAGDFNVPLILLSQLNRSPSSEQRPPRLVDLRDSGSIENDSDNVIFLDAYDEETKEVTLMIAKQRNGITGDIQLKYIRNTFSFYDVRL